MPEVTEREKRGEPPGLSLAIFPGLMLCAPPEQAPVPTVHPSQGYQTPGAGAALSCVYAAHGRSPQRTQTCQENAAISSTCLPWLSTGLSVAVVGPPPGGGEERQEGLSAGEHRTGGRCGREKRSQDSGTPSTRRGPPSGVEGRLQAPQEATSLALSTRRARWTVTWPELLDERREQAPARGRERDSEAKPTDLLSSSCLQPCPSGPFLTQAIFLKPLLQDLKDSHPYGTCHAEDWPDTLMS